MSATFTVSDGVESIDVTYTPTPGPHSVRLEAGGTPVTATLSPGAEVSGAQAAATGGPITRSAVRGVSGATATATGSLSLSATLAVSGAQADTSAGTIEILAADAGHRIRLVAGGAPAYADLVPGVDVSGALASSGAGAIAIGAQVPFSGAQAAALSGGVGLALGISGSTATASAGGTALTAIVPVAGAQANATRGQITFSDGTTLPPPATLHNPVLGTLPHPWWRRHGRAW